MFGRRLEGADSCRAVALRNLKCLIEQNLDVLIEADRVEGTKFSLYVSSSKNVAYSQAQ